MNPRNGPKGRGRRVATPMVGPKISLFLPLRVTRSVLSSLSEGRLGELWPRSTHSERLVSGSQNVRTTHNTPHTDTTRRERHTTHANGSLRQRSMFTFSTRWFIGWVLKVMEQNPTIAENVEHATVTNGSSPLTPEGCLSELATSQFDQPVSNTAYSIFQPQVKHNAFTMRDMLSHTLKRAHFWQGCSTTTRFKSVA